MTMLTSSEFDTIRVYESYGTRKKMSARTHTDTVNMFSIYLIDACIHKIFGINRLSKPVHSLSLSLSVYFDEQNANDSVLPKYFNEVIIFFFHKILKEMTNFECTMNKVWFKLLAKLRKKNHTYTRTHTNSQIGNYFLVACGKFTHNANIDKVKRIEFWSTIDFVCCRSSLLLLLLNEWDIL